MLYWSFKKLMIGLRIVRTTANFHPALLKFDRHDGHLRTLTHTSWGVMSTDYCAAPLLDDGWRPTLAGHVLVSPPIET